jgi:hypothetical protein
MTAAAYRELRASVFGEGLVSEDGPRLLPGAGGGRPSEAELQSRWFAGEFGGEFATTSGQRVEIVQIGTWNHAAGPDFAHVAVRLGGRLLTGALELDWDARDWERHGHAENPAYEGVVLHVFFEQPAGAAFFTRTPQHREVAQVRIDLAAFPSAGPPPPPAEAKCGRCSFPLRDLPAAEVESLLAAAARQRLERKARRLARLASLHGWDQTLFQELAAALGYRRNQQAMTMLAQRLPLRLLSAHAAGAEALLFGAAGFLEARIHEKAPPDSRDYLRGHWETWWKHRGEFSGVAPPKWALAGARPQNHPHRRLGALAQVVRQWKSIRAAFEPAAHGGSTPGQPLAAALSAVRHPHWDHHFSLASARQPEPLALIGSTRIQEILANLAFPLLSLHPESAAASWAAYAAQPAALENEKSRRAALRLLGRRRDAAALTTKLFHQQALLQIYDDFCLQDSSDCHQCLFPEQLARWPAFGG